MLCNDNTTREKVVLPDRLIAVKSFIASSDRHRVHPHWHPEIEILYYIQGSASQQSGDSFFTASTGDIVIIGRNQLHSTYTYGGKTCLILVIQFDPESILCSAMSASERKHTLCFLEEGIRFKTPVSSDSSEGSQLMDCLSDIHREYENKALGYELFTRSFLIRIAGILTRFQLYEIPDSTKADMARTREMLEKTFCLIDETTNDRISLKEAAAASNLSVTHFCRLFKKATGMTFSDYHCFYKVNRAEKLLNTGMTITQVAMESGFGSLLTFIRNFKRFKKCTPTQYRNILSNKEEPQSRLSVDSD